MKDEMITIESLQDFFIEEILKGKKTGEICEFHIRNHRFEKKVSIRNMEEIEIDVINLKKDNYIVIQKTKNDFNVYCKIGNEMYLEQINNKVCSLN